MSGGDDPIVNSQSRVQISRLPLIRLSGFERCGWLSPEGRRLEIEGGKPLLHRFWTTCHRNFVRDLLTGNCYIVSPRILDFQYLDHVSERWRRRYCAWPLVGDYRFRYCVNQDDSWSVSYVPIRD